MATIVSKLESNRYKIVDNNQVGRNTLKNPNNEKNSINNKVLPLSEWNIDKDSLLDASVKRLPESMREEYTREYKNGNEQSKEFLLVMISMPVPNCLNNWTGFVA
jgi:hypothetical protein